MFAVIIISSTLAFIPLPVFLVGSHVATEYASNNCINVWDYLHLRLSLIQWLAFLVGSLRV